jgi:hypothetical protein
MYSKLLEEQKMAKKEEPGFSRKVTKKRNTDTYQTKVVTNNLDPEMEFYGSKDKKQANLLDNLMGNSHGDNHSANSSNFEGLPMTRAKSREGGMRK